MGEAELRERARAWAAADPDPATRSELESLLEQDDLAELRDRFDGTLEFGTAGLRGALGAGPNRMNRVVVLRAAAGLAGCLRDHGAGPGDAVVIGYDARHRSADFARDTAAVMTGAGLRALLLPEPLPTPVLAFAIRDLGCVAGVMVTASHNPPQDNGYKVYLGDGSQIVPPADAEIAARIEAVGEVEAITRGGDAEVVAPDLVERYLDAAVGLLAPGPRDLALVHTPLHGVGGRTVLDALERAGFAAPAVPPAQADPDPDFPTTPFPQPRGARGDGPRARAGADDRRRPRGGQRPRRRPVRGGRPWPARLDRAAGRRRGRPARPPPPTPGADRHPCHDHRLLHAARRAGAGPRPRDYRETLTGFKWLARVEGLAYAYEEALGYCVDPAHVRDKDGISALLLVCELAAQEKAVGRTLLDVLDDLAVEHGLHATDQLSVRMADLDQIPAVVDRLRQDPPATLGGLAVERVDDLAEGSEELPPTNGLRLVLADGARVVVRPSGTEPKLKCYLQVVMAVPEEGGVDAARISAAGRLDAIRADLRAVTGA